MKLTDQLAGRIANTVLADLKKRGCEPWSVSPAALVRGAIAQWEKMKKENAK